MSIQFAIVVVGVVCFLCGALVGGVIAVFAVRKEIDDTLREVYRLDKGI